MIIGSSVQKVVVEALSTNLLNFILEVKETAIGSLTFSGEVYYEDILLDQIDWTLSIHVSSNDQSVDNYSLHLFVVPLLIGLSKLSTRSDD